MPEATIQKQLRRQRRGGWRRAVLLTLVILGGYALLAYLVLPGVWTHYEHQRGLAVRGDICLQQRFLTDHHRAPGLWGEVAYFDAAGSQTDGVVQLERDKCRRLARKGLEV